MNLLLEYVHGNVSFLLGLEYMDGIFQLKWIAHAVDLQSCLSGSADTMEILINTTHERILQS
jgi:hypothetical protein